MSISKIAILKAAKNETTSFQIFVSSESEFVVFDIEKAILTGHGGAVIGIENIIMYREHSVNITTPTYRNTTFVGGWYPDALIPFEHQITRLDPVDPKFIAVPFTVQRNKRQGFWVDIFVPKGTADGQYSGVFVVVTSKGSFNVLVNLTVWNFELPDTMSMKTNICYPPGAVLEKIYPIFGKVNTDWPATYTQIADELRKCYIDVPVTGISLVPVLHEGTYQFSSDTAKNLQKLIDKYYKNTVYIQSPAKTISDPIINIDQLRNFLAAYDKLAIDVGRDVDYITYLFDEPATFADYEFIRRWGKAVHECKTILMVLVTEQTKPQNSDWGDLYGAVDIFVSLFPLYDDATASERRKGGDENWCYTALAQGIQESPWWSTDRPTLNYRIPFWIAWRYAITGILYWGGMVHWHNCDDPFTQSVTHTVSDTCKFNGEGTMFYPSWPLGFDGVIPSIRVKAFRDGIRDYEYMMILERAGKRDEAMAIITSLATSWFEWEKDPKAIDLAREQLAALILEGV